jgi:hypothetical protein
MMGSCATELVSVERTHSQEYSYVIADVDISVHMNKTWLLPFVASWYAAPEAGPFGHPCCSLSKSLNHCTFVHHISVHKQRNQRNAKLTLNTSLV